MSKPRSSKEDIDRDLVAWQKRARDAFKARGFGSKSKCARDIGCSPSEVSALLAGRIKNTHWSLAVSRWLHITPPARGLPEVISEIMSGAESLSEDDQLRVLDLVTRLRRSKND